MPSKQRYKQHKAWYDEYYQKNREKKKAYQKQHQLQNRKRYNEYSLNFYYKNKPYYYEKSHAVYNLNKSLLYDILGGAKCVECGYNNPLGLQFDHINSDGSKDRKEIGAGRTLILYYARHPQEARLKLQVLCANCNQVKRHTNNEFRK